MSIDKAQSGRETRLSDNVELFHFQIQREYPPTPWVNCSPFCFLVQIALVTGQTPVWPWFTITSMEAETLDLRVVLKYCLRKILMILLKWNLNCSNFFPDPASNVQKLLSGKSGPPSRPGYGSLDNRKRNSPENSERNKISPSSTLESRRQETNKCLPCILGGPLLGIRY